MSTIAELYDRVAYPAHAYADTRPSRLATMARLHGLNSAAPEACRVLEIGCNAGANLIPMAYALPGSEFTGFDLAGAPIAVGQEKIKALGLKNVRLLQADLMEAELSPELAGEFDYIVAHGVYAWVPEPVRDRLLAYCRAHLAENGVAFISYAALPGGHVRLMTREIMARSRERWYETAADVQEAIEFLKVVTNARPDGDAFKILLQRELDNIARRGPEAVFHDEAAPFYRPVYFREFATHAGEHGLRYFGESDLPRPADASYQVETVGKIRELSADDAMAQEQMLDCARMRVYRESLLCHGAASSREDLQLEALRTLFFTTSAQARDGSKPGSRVYELPGGIKIETENAATILLMENLVARAPEWLSFAEAADAPLQENLLTEPGVQVLLMRLMIARFAEADAWKAPLRREIGERPLASLVCREEALHGSQVVTLLHTTLSVADPTVRHLLLLLDGSRDRAALVSELAAAFPDLPEGELAEGLENTLRMFNVAGALEAVATQQIKETRATLPGLSASEVALRR